MEYVSLWKYQHPKEKNKENTRQRIWIREDFRDNLAKKKVKKIS